jgi:flavin reductase (DIM6/NTAB) family NADH-FMN oxidoreductase RutF
VLHTANIDIAKIFSSNATAAERFGTGDWRADAEGTPYLANAQANLFCRKEQEITCGSHTIFIGRVLQAMTREDISPLIYRDGRYASAADDTSAK